MCPTELDGRQELTRSETEKQSGIIFSSKESKRGGSIYKVVAVSKSLLHILHSLKVSFDISLVLVYHIAITSPIALGEWGLFF